MKFTMFKRWLEVHLEQPFEDFEFHEIDARHLVAIACATFDPTSQRMLALMLAMKGQGRILKKITEILADTNLQMNWDHGLAGVELTSVGLIVGALAYDQRTGRDLGPPKWD